MLDLKIVAKHMQQALIATFVVGTVGGSVWLGVELSPVYPEVHNTRVAQLIGAISGYFGSFIPLLIISGLINMLGAKRRAKQLQHK